MAMTSVTDARQADARQADARHSTALAALTRMMNDGFAAGNPDVVDELLGPDCIEHQFGLEGVGASAIAHVKAAIADVHGALPDLSFTLEDSVEAGDTAWARFRGTAT